MSAAITIAAHNLRRIIRRPVLLLLLLAVPLTLILIEVLAFGPMTKRGGLSAIRVLILNLDKSLAAQCLISTYREGPGHGYVELSEVGSSEEAKQLLRREQASALIVIPNGFHAGLMNREPAHLEFYSSPTQTIAPHVAWITMKICAAIMDGVVQRAPTPLEGLRDLALAFPQAAEHDDALNSLAAPDPGYVEKLQLELGSLRELSVDVRRPAGGEGKSISEDITQFFGKLFPGLALFGAFFLSQALAAPLQRDRANRIWPRLSTTPIRPGSLIAGEMIYLFTGTAFLLLIICFVGFLAFHISFALVPTLLLFCLGVALSLAGIQGAIYAAMRTERGAQGLSTILGIGLSLFGGAFFPIDSLPQVLASIARSLPNGAAQEGMVRVLTQPVSLGDLAWPLTVTWGWAIVLLFSAVVLQRRNRPA